MNTFITVIQTGANEFKTFKFKGENQVGIYPQVRQKGALVTCWPSNHQNDEYCNKLARKMSGKE